MFIISSKNKLNGSLVPTRDNDSSLRFRGFPAGTRGKLQKMVGRWKQKYDDHIWWRDSPGSGWNRSVRFPLGMKTIFGSSSIVFGTAGLSSCVVMHWLIML